MCLAAYFDFQGWNKALEHMENVPVENSAFLQVKSRRFPQEKPPKFQEKFLYFFIFQAKIGHLPLN